jgi:PIN domain nuclease of toxin-antitoxin system
VSIELTLLHEAGRKLITATELVAATRRNSEVRILPLDSAQASEFELLSALNDPFDRLIVAAARATERPLITADTLITDSSLVEVVWD